MTTAEVALPSSTAKTPVTQTAAVEQSRAVAEVQAAVYVAQQFPRDMRRVWDEVRDACSRLALADRAFYAVPNRGSGPSVHLARAIIQIYGNSDSGVRELSRDDAAEMSEIQAFAWDQQRNSRTSRTFQVPHAHMVKPDKKSRAVRVPLVDLDDVYRNNQSIGAKALRECIAAILPVDLWNEAQRLCRETVNKGDGKPLVDRINNMVTAFKDIGVSVAQLETRLDRPRREWTGADVGQMIIAYTSIQNSDAAKDDLFPPVSQRVTASEIIGDQPAAPVTVPKMTAKQRGQMFALLAQLGHGGKSDEERAARLQFIGDILGIDVETTSDLDDEQAAILIEQLHQKVEATDA